MSYHYKGLGLLLLRMRNEIKVLEEVLTVPLTHKKTINPRNINKWGVQILLFRVVKRLKVW
jgi:hypothetical protein